MSLKVINHFPSVNETGVFLNETIRVYFNKPIDELSIQWDNFSVNDTNSFSTVVGNLGPIWASGINLSGVTSGLAFLPTINMLPNTEYSVYVFSKPNSVLGKDGSEISETYSYSFVTGTGYYDEVGNVGTPSGTTTTTTIDLSGIPNFEESSITEFGVYGTSPKNQDANVALSIPGIYITFNGNLQTDLATTSGLIILDGISVL
jgi:hypothetical protein